MLPREDVAAALFALTAPIAKSAGGLFVTRSRRIVPAPQVAAQQCPALYQIQDNESIAQDTRTLQNMYASDFKFAWLVYTNASDTTNPSSPALNYAVDAAVGVLTPNAIEPFTVNGVGCVLYWDGSINYFEGIIQDKSVAEIPILVRVPWAVQA